MTEQPGPLETTREFAAVDLADMLNDEPTYTGPSSRTRLVAILVVAAMILSVGATAIVLLLG
ncbi:hypothetical protein ACFO5K_05310 [Nocardia halotolerans]|uniref:Uncharacterized protein n=1 Tax=Nocardia halotolerans TaxID=1755878 RepID=A0ABV8VE42_9NOCA